MKRSHFGRGYLLLLLVTAFLIAPLAVWAQTWYDHIDGSNEFSNDDPAYNVRHSDHTRLRWGKNNVSGITVDEDFIQENLQNQERHWHLMFDAPASGGCGFPSPSVLWSGNDGKNYRANFRIGQTWGNPDDGGAGGSVDWDGIPTYGMGPWAMAPSAPTTVPYHEFGHGILIWMKGLNNTPYDGMWHEGWANFSEEQGANDIDPSNMLWCHSFFLPHGRDYYDSWIWWEHLRETPGYGPTFLTTLFEGCQGSASEYVFDAMTRLDPASTADHQNNIKDLIGLYARKNVTWDYERGDLMRNYSFAPNNTDPTNDSYRRLFTELVKEPGSTTVYRVPFDQAPSQGGYDILPIKLTNKVNGTGGYTVGITLKPVWDGVRQSDWRATLVAVNNNGGARYSSMWNGGTNSITLSGDENKLYLVVAATPSFLGDPGRSFLYQPCEAPQPFEVSFADSNATAYETTAMVSSSGLTQVTNGGGYRASTATVASTAYVGPNARVLGYAQVLGDARIEDDAVVTDSVIVKDNAVVSGHAIVSGSAQIYGNAKVRDWARVCDSAQVYENGKVLEHAHVGESACKVHGYATEKGQVWDGGSADVSGYAIKEGDCLNTANFDHGVLMCWVWGIDQGFADSQPDTGGLYCSYGFQKASPIYAMDTYGIIHGYLMGTTKPSRVLIADWNRQYALSLDGSSQYVELRDDASDLRDTTIACWVKWTGSANDQRIFSFGDGSGKYMYLTPKDATTGYLRLVVTDGTTTQYLNGTAALTANRWTHIAVTFSGSTMTYTAGPPSSNKWTATATLYVDGVAGTPVSNFLVPDQVRATNTLGGGQCNYIGKSPAGNYFQGYIDDFYIYAQNQNSTVITTLASQFTDRNAGPGTPTPPAPPSPTTLWYKFDETSGTTATDSSGSGMNGTVTSGTWTAGYLNNCLQFNGTSSYVQVPNLSSSVSQCTITMWINVTSIAGGSGWAGTALAATDGWGTGDIITELIGTGATDGTAGKLQWAQWNSGISLYSNTKFDSASGNQGKWVHVALTFDGTVGTAKIYINGVLDNSATGTASTTVDLTQLRIGSWGGNDRFFNGKIDDFRIYNRVLSDAEMSYFVPYTPPAADTTAPTPTTETWLINPTTVNASSITMSATKGTDAGGNGVLYYFKCTAGGGHDSGWISSNKYTDLGLTAGTQYTYTVQMKDTLGNTGTASTAQNATTTATDTTAPTPNPATFAVNPIGISTSAITMTATKGTDANPLIEYKFTGSNGHTSGWQASPTWTDTGLTANSTATYTVQMRDGLGNTGTASGSSPTATARDDQAPTTTSVARAVWQMRPYIKTNGQLWMRARTATDPSGVQYYFHCSAGGGPDSSWQDSNEWTSPTTVANGTYTYQIRIRDKSPQSNQTAYMGDINVVVNNFNMYHDYALSALSGLADETLVHFTGTVTTVNTDNYIVTSGGSTIRVYPNTVNGATDSSLLNKSVDVKACLWTYTAYGKVANYATVAGIWTITASAGANGTISPIGNLIVLGGTNQTFQMVPDRGYVVDTVTVDSVSQGSISAYTFSNVSASHTISVTFKADTSPDGMVYYHFDETSGSTASDSSGNGNNGTCNGGYTWGAGKINNCVTLNGSTGYVSIPNLGSQSSFTIATWIYLNAYPGDYGAIFLTDAWASGALHCNLQSNGTFACQVYDWNTGVNSVSALPLGSWNHIAYTYDGTTKIVKVYLNGAVDNSVTLTTGGAAAMNAAKIGSWAGSSRFINGKFDDYHIYGRALSDLEVQRLYTYNGTTYTITASSGSGGYISPSGSVIVNSGASQTFNIIPNIGNSISQVTVDSVNQGAISTYTFTNVQANHTISATFTGSTYTITASAGTGGTISPSGAVQVNPGANQTFTITPNSGYMVSGVTVDSVSVGVVKSYTFTNVQANHTISVTFASNTDTVAYYKFDETSGTTAYDCTANAKNGTLYGSCSWVAGKTNNAVKIPGGSSDYVGLPTGEVSGLTNFTIVAWVNLTSRSTNMRIFDFGTSTSNYMMMTPQHSSSSGKIEFYIRTSSTTKSVLGSAALPTGSWQQVAVTLSGQTLTLYVQGAQVGQITNCSINPNSLGSTTNNYIGKSQTSSHPHLNGLVDGFRIYNRALTGTEISTLYNGGAGPASIDEDDSGWDIYPAK